MRPARPFPRAVNPELNGHVSSTQRRRERRDKRREDQASQNLRIQSCRVSRTLRRHWSKPLLASGESRSVVPSAVFSLVFSALPLRSLRLCVEDKLTVAR